MSIGQIPGTGRTDIVGGGVQNDVQLAPRSINATALEQFRATQASLRSGHAAKLRSPVDEERASIGDLIIQAPFAVAAGH
ncbi:1b2e9b19-ed9d-43f5-888f-34cecd7d8bb1 [Thermothielavioides terrestris]|uniref:1b2e9b19-ed9d-43f5-888f-34cecd7d8bb1 n=1 Tax=Thermothielavioides terrestris TaxID=2587410 RepID=A0A3S5CW93_9PEZI|nr:1b2e9b19-ed9d-43f5-888f-34cecd7d8bb1 [Thermothielavioides terrestris]